MTTARQRPLDTRMDAVLAEFTAATVSTYLPILIERRARDRLGAPR